VDQTQKYSSLLAQRLGAGEDTLALPAPQSTPAPANPQTDLAVEAMEQLPIVKAESAAELSSAQDNAADEKMAEAGATAGSPAALEIEPYQNSQVLLSIAATLGACFPSHLPEICSLEQGSLVWTIKKWVRTRSAHKAHGCQSSQVLVKGFQRVSVRAEAPAAI